MHCRSQLTPCYAPLPLQAAKDEGQDAALAQPVAPVTSAPTALVGVVQSPAEASVAATPAAEAVAEAAGQPEAAAAEAVVEVCLNSVRKAVEGAQEEQPGTNDGETA